MCIKRTLVERVHADRDRGWDSGSGVSWTEDIVPLVDAYDTTIAEVERLRGELATLIVQADEVVRDHAEHFREQERERVVAWLREQQESVGLPLTAAGYEHAADCIERGEHRREEK